VRIEEVGSVLLETLAACVMSACLAVSRTILDPITRLVTRMVAPAVLWATAAGPIILASQVRALTTRLSRSCHVISLALF
jgi:hypothetical protein